MIRVFLVDDHEIVRRGIADIIDAAGDLQVVGESGTVRGTLGRVAATLPDVVVLDVRLGDGNGVDLCRDIRSAFPDIACLMLTAFDDDEASRLAVVAGAAGYVLKDIRGQKLVDGIRLVARGQSLIASGLRDRVAAELHRPMMSADAAISLTLRESQVLQLIADGLTNRQIGERLELAEKTVKNYVSSLLAKLGMESRTQAAVYGARLAGDDR